MSIIIDGVSLSLDEIESFINLDEKIEIKQDSISRIEKSFNIIKECINTDKVVYGINTGFGKLCNTIINKEDLRKLQVNLLRSHAVGVGKNLSRNEARASILIRLNSLVRGNSGVGLETVNLILKILNNNVYPLIPGIGSLGASGDLAPLAHFALLLIGEGECIYNGEKISGKDLLEQLRLEPLVLQPKEGLALINGTSVSSGIFANDLIKAKNVILGGICAAILSLSAFLARRDVFSPALNILKPHKGQMLIANLFFDVLSDSKLTNSAQRIQDPYSFRCIPQVFGPVLDCYNYCKSVLEVEINSATDNPLIILDDKEIISGGNFHGEPIALAADFLSISLSVLGEMSERRVNQLLDPNLNGDLNPFLASNPGIESGFMIAQYTDAALVSRNKILAFPASLTSVPVSGEQEDFVSQSANATLKLSEIIENLSDIIAIEMLVASQALEARDMEKAGKVAKDIYNYVRSISEPLKEDRSLSKNIKDLSNKVLAGELKNLIPYLESYNLF